MITREPVAFPLGAAGPSAELASRPVLQCLTQPDGSGFDPATTRSGNLLSEMRALRRRVLEATSATRRSGRSAVVMVTSAIPGDGKSFTSFHLSLSLVREKDLGVTLVDGDVARQQTSQLFDATRTPGLAGLITGAAHLRNVVHPTSLPGITFVPAGERSLEVADCLASSRWDDVIAEMQASGGNRMFVLDTAPILATSEAQFAARNVDLILFVVRAEATPQEAVEQALARLGDASKVAFVFNRVAPIAADPYYDYADYGSSPKARR